jgi:hypothetical protein
MTWENYKKELHPFVEKAYNKGLDTETLILTNGHGVSKYDPRAKKQKILNTVK